MEYVISLFLNTVKKTTTNRKEYLKELVKLVQFCLTDLASALFVYMLFLEKTDRKEEAELLKEYRDTLFKYRDHFTISKDNLNDLFEENTEKHISNIVEYLLVFRDKINIQSLMLRNSSEDKRWEHIIFQTVTNEAMNLRFKLNNELKYDTKLT